MDSSRKLRPCRFPKPRFHMKFNNVKRQYPASTHVSVTRPSPFYPFTFIQAEEKGS